MAIRRRSLLMDLSASYQGTGRLLELMLDDDELVEHYDLYSALAHSGQATIGQLTTELGRPRSTVIFNVNKLVERGHAERVPHPRDGRSSFVALTPEGERRLQLTRPAFLRMLELIERRLTVPRTQARLVLADVLAAIEKAIAAEELRRAA